MTRTGAYARPIRRQALPKGFRRSLCERKPHSPLRSTPDLVELIPKDTCALSAVTPPTHGAYRATSMGMIWISIHGAESKYRGSLFGFLRP